MSKASRRAYGGTSGGYSSSLGKTPGTLSRTSSSSGQVYSTVEERKEANVILQQTGVEPTPAQMSQSVPKPSAAQQKRITAADILSGRVQGRGWIGVVGGKTVSGVTFGEETPGYRKTAYVYGDVPDTQIRSFRKAQRERAGLMSAYSVEAQGIPAGTVSEYKPTSTSSTLRFLFTAKGEQAILSRYEWARSGVEKFQSKMAFTSQYSPSTAKRLGAGAISFGIGVLKPTVLYPSEFVLKPLETIKGFGRMAVSFARNPTELGYQVGEKIQRDPFGSMGEVVGYRYGIIKPFKNVYVRAGSEFVAPERIFSPKVLAGKEVFPSTTGVSDALSKFKKAEFNVIHATEKTFPKKTQTMAGSSADVGLYVAPKGLGSPYFLRVGGMQGYSLRPQIIPPAFSIPTAVELSLKGVRRMPAGIRTGSRATRTKFLESQAGKPYAFITSELERGKGELEAVIPPGTSLEYARKGGFVSNLKGFRYYTKVGGENVAIQEFRIMRGGKVTGRQFVRLSERSSSYFGKKKAPVYKAYSLAGSRRSKSSRISQSSITLSRVILPVRESPQIISRSAIKPRGSSVIPRTPIRTGRGRARGSSVAPSTVSRGTSAVRTPGVSAVRIPRVTSAPVPSYKRFQSFKSKTFGKSKRPFFKIKVAQPRGLTPSGWAAVGGVRGKIKLGDIKTGLGGRPIRKFIPFVRTKI